MENVGYFILGLGVGWVVTTILYITLIKIDSVKGQYYFGIRYKDGTSQGLISNDGWPWRQIIQIIKMIWNYIKLCFRR